MFALTLLTPMSISQEDEMSDNGQTTTAIARSEEGASKITNRYVLWAMGAGLVPIPIVDFAAIVGVQLKMLSSLAKYYGVDFSEERGKSVVSSLVGSVAADSLAYGSVGSFPEVNSRSRHTIRYGSNATFCWCHHVCSRESVPNALLFWWNAFELRRG